MSDANSSGQTAAQTMSSFFTRERANEGIEFTLDLPDGTPTKHRIKIRGMDSDAFKAAKADSRRRLLELAQRASKAEIDAVDADAENIRLVATLVVSWTFSEDCTHEGVCKLLREAPQIAEQIDRIAGRRALFMRKESPNSTPSQSPKSP